MASLADSTNNGQHNMGSRLPYSQSLTFGRGEVSTAKSEIEVAPLKQVLCFIW
jgi:hypothetical protein